MSLEDRYWRFSTRSVVDIRGLLEHWPGVLEEEVAALIEDNVLPAYWIRKRQRNDKGEVVLVCVSVATALKKEGGYDWDGFVFLVPEICIIEAKRPDFLWPVLVDEESTKARGKCAPDAIAKWKEALSKATIRPPARKRLTILLKRLAGEKVAALAHEYTTRNIGRDVRKAKTEDVPKMRQLTPDLPDLDW